MAVYRPQSVSVTPRLVSSRRKRQVRPFRLSLLLLGILGVLWLGYQGVQSAGQLFAGIVSPASKASEELLIGNEMDTVVDLSVSPPMGPALGLIDSQMFPLSVVPKKKLWPILESSEDSYLKSQLLSLFSQYPETLVPHLYYVNLQTHRAVSINAHQAVAAASVIKLPILMNYLLHVDQHLLEPDGTMFYQDHHRAEGSGFLQYQPSGQALTSSDVAAQMIQWSDNTCTNMMIEQLGGIQGLNNYFASWGLGNTRIRNMLPDLDGTNTISTYEMATLLYNLNLETLLSKPTLLSAFKILHGVHNRSLIRAKLPPSVTVAHKTGDIQTSLGDSGIVYLPDDRRYILSIQVERSPNDAQARDLIQKTSELIYNYEVSHPLEIKG